MLVLSRGVSCGVSCGVSFGRLEMTIGGVLCGNAVNPESDFEQNNSNSTLR